eukprot:3041351-Prymnesium_polylepis.2
MGCRCFWRTRVRRHTAASNKAGGGSVGQEPPTRHRIKSGSALRACAVPGEVVNEARHAVDFDAFFAFEDGTTPPKLLRAGIYDQIAIALKDGPWRRASLVLVAHAIALQSQAGESSVNAMTEIMI